MDSNLILMSKVFSISGSINIRDLHDPICYQFYSSIESPT